MTVTKKYSLSSCLSLLLGLFSLILTQPLFSKDTEESWKVAKLVSNYEDDITFIEYVLYSTWSDKPSILLGCKDKRYFAQLAIKPVKMEKYLDWYSKRKRGIQDVNEFELLINGQSVVTPFDGSFDRKNKVLAVYYHGVTKAIMGAIEQSYQLQIRNIKSGKVHDLPYPKLDEKLEILKSVCE